MKKISILVFFIFMVSFVSADGMFHIYENDVWEMGSENQQLAAINYEGGFENLLISVDVSNEVKGERGVWIFPVPSNPDDVVIDILRGLPWFLGKDINSEFDERVTTTTILMAGYSLFPVSLPGLFIWAAVMPMMKEQIAGSSFESEFPELVVHERIEKMGLVTELITSTQGNTLKDYLTLKGLDLPLESREILDYYVEKNYTFVVSYIEDLDEFKKEAAQNYEYVKYYDNKPVFSLGVFVKFPTDKIYFPLKPTSVYGNESIPIFIYCLGHVTPGLYPKIKPHSEVKYYVQDSYSTQKLVDFFNGKTYIENLEYTRIKLNTSSKNFEEDLWFENYAPASIGVKENISRHLFLGSILFFIIFSMLASLFAGMISFRGDVSKGKLLVFGLWNLLTMIGFLNALVVIKTKKLSDKLEGKLKHGKIKRGVKDYRKILFAVLFYVFFLVLIGLMFGVLKVLL